MVLQLGSDKGLCIFVGCKSIKKSANCQQKPFNRFQLIKFPPKPSMAKSPKVTPIHSLNDAIVHGIQEKKGTDIVILDLRELGETVTDYFIVCHATSTTQVKAIAGSIEEEVRKLMQSKPWHVEGIEHSQWVLMDYVNTVVHVFLKDLREYYRVEDLWNDAQRTDVPNLS